MLTEEVIVGFGQWIDIIPFLGSQYKIHFEFWIQHQAMFESWKKDGYLVDFESDSKKFIIVAVVEGKLVVKNLLNDKLFKGTDLVPTNQWISLNIIQLKVVQHSLH